MQTCAQTEHIVAFQLKTRSLWPGSHSSEHLLNLCSCLKPSTSCMIAGSGGQEITTSQGHSKVWSIMSWASSRHALAHEWLRANSSSHQVTPQVWLLAACWRSASSGWTQEGLISHVLCQQLNPLSPHTPMSHELSCADSSSQRGHVQVWLLAAQLEVRQLRLDSARKILGMALGMCPKHKLFKAYIDLELQLGHVERCRT